MFSTCSTHDRLDDCFDVIIVGYSVLRISTENAWIDHNTTRLFTIILDSTCDGSIPIWMGKPAITYGDEKIYDRMTADNYIVLNRKL